VFEWTRIVSHRRTHAAGAPLITHTHTHTNIHTYSISLAINMFLLGFSLCLGIVHGIVPEIAKTDMDIIANMETNVVQGQSTLNDVLKEVEEDLMEDTQQKLEDAVHQVSAFNTIYKRRFGLSFELLS